MIRVADYIANYIYNLGVEHVFMVSGGGMMFLSDGLVKHPKIQVVCNHHEQASAMAAVSYAKYNGYLGVAYVTTGCGGTNTITGLLGAWQDSTPCIFISGQSKIKETVRNSNLKLRQFGVQEADIVSIVESITKYAVMVKDPSEIAYHLDKAVFLAKSGRPGPVWIDVPLDVQGSMIDENNLKRFDRSGLIKDCCEEPSRSEVEKFINMFRTSRRPVIIVGQGVRLAGAVDHFKSFVEESNIPVVASRLGIGVLATTHPLFIGRIGNKGDRPGNFAVQNADLVIAIGSRLSVSSTGHEYNNFAREAKIIVVDIDAEEHRKATVRIDMFINADANKFLNAIDGHVALNNVEWLSQCSKWKETYPVCLPEYKNDTKGINLYYFVDRLSKKLKEDSVVVSDAGSAFYVTSQAIQLEIGQRYITAGGQADMGYGLPACIGVCFARDCREVIGITGDGSLQMNIQELQTLVHHDIPVKLFVWNNDGYLSIRATQSKFFDGRFIGTDSASGVSFPSTEKIANAYGLRYFRISKVADLDRVIEDVLKASHPVICEVMCIRDQEIVPTVSARRKGDGTLVSKPIEDMYPFMDREEFNKNMIVKPVKEEG